VGLTHSSRALEPYREGLTEDQAFIEAERYDKELVRSQFMSNTDPWSLHNLGAAFSSAIFDPLSYIPMVGLGSKIFGLSKNVTKRMSTVANVATEVHPAKLFALGAVKPFKPIGVYSAEGALAESAFQLVRASAETSNGKDFDYMGAMLDVTIATTFGGVLGTIPTAKILKDKFTEKQITTGIFKAVDDLKNHGEVRLDGQGGPFSKQKPTKEQSEASYKHDMDELKQTTKKELDKDLHPIQDYMKTLNEDLTTGLTNLIRTFRGCSK